MLRVSKRQGVRSVGGSMFSSWELGEMLCSVGCHGVVVSMPVLQAGDPRVESRWQHTFAERTTEGDMIVSPSVLNICWNMDVKVALCVIGRT